MTSLDHFSERKPEGKEAKISLPEDSISLEYATNVDEKKLLRKLDWKLLPALISLYLLSFLDRSNG